MSSNASAGAVVMSPAERLEVVFEELAELTGQRNAIDGRIVQIVAAIDRGELCGVNGADPQLSTQCDNHPYRLAGLRGRSLTGKVAKLKGLKGLKGIRNF